MSVINQMLKDLDSRNRKVDENTFKHGTLQYDNAENNKINFKIFASVFLTLLIVSCLLFWFFKTSENRSEINGNNVIEKKLKKDAVINGTKNNIVDMPLAQFENIKDKLRVKKSIEQTSENKQITEVKKATEATQTTDIKNELLILKNKLEKKEAMLDHLITNMEKEKKIPIENKDNQESKKSKEEKDNVVKISRKTISTDELVQKKYIEAEKALMEKRVQDAETLYEDILILTPNNLKVRKKLAALWYGKKEYQSAINLLSQGLALNSGSQDIRLMMAQIYYDMRNLKLAFKVLEPIKSEDSVKLQTFLATLSTEMKQYNSAISAYSKLSQLQPDLSKWELGLAISYDRSEQYEQASMAYHAALNKGQLSESAQRFVVQRLKELGE